MLDSKDDLGSGLTLDFSPATSHGMTCLENMLYRIGLSIDWVVCIQVTAKVARERFVRRGQRFGDLAKDMDSFFQYRIVKEFWPFTLPIVRDAFRSNKLLILDNGQDDMHLQNEIERISKMITKV